MGFRKLLIPIPIPILLCFSFVFPQYFSPIFRLRRHLYASIKIRLWGGKSCGHPFDPNRATQLLTHPRVFSYRNFLSDEECDHLIGLAEGKLQRSLVNDIKTGKKGVVSIGRTSTGMSLQKAQDEIVGGIESRISAWAQLPIENGASIQVLRYEKGQKVVPHCDYLDDEMDYGRSGNRMATVVMYLSDVKKGGETLFSHPNIKVSDKDRSLCAKSGYAVKPRKGDAILFYSLHPDATIDPLSLHEGRPVIEGEKWCATKFIHVRSVDGKGVMLVGGSKMTKISKA